MNQRISNERVWPYVLPFPLDSEKRGLIWSILQSRVGLKIIERISVNKRTYQHDLIEKLPYSNKSIIKYLKKMVKGEVLEQGMETSKEKGRTVWIKWYKPTSLGKWLTLFLKSPSEVPLDLTKTVVEELFHLYASSIVEVCQRYSLDIDSFHRDLDRQYLLEIIKKQPQVKAEVAVFGSAALDIYGSVERLPASDEVVFVKETARYPGGMGANVAVALSKLNVPVVFLGRMGSDSAGRVLLENLSKNNIDVSNIRFVDMPSLQTLILSDNQEHRWLFAVGLPQSAISLTSLEEIDWKALDHCRIVYIGEVFTEIASSIADYAKTRKKLVVYRPGTPYMRFGVKRLHRILEHTNILILNQAGWRRLQETSKEKMENPADLLKYGLENVVLTKSAEGCEVFSANKHLKLSVAPQLRAKFKTVDPTGAGDGFSAGLIKGLLRGWSLEQAIVYGQAVASITCSRVGAGNAFPTEEEVEAAVDISPNLN
jgi:ribokinase